jgi:N-acetylglutamate synthase-like GNAT family acetyltransferase
MWIYIILDKLFYVIYKKKNQLFYKKNMINENFKFSKIEKISAQKILKNFDKFLFPVFKKKIMANLITEDLFIIRAQMENTILGLIIFEIKNNLSAEIHSVFVDEKYRNKGIGTKLLEKCEKFLENFELKNVDLIYFSYLESKDFIDKYLSNNNWLESKKTAENFNIDNYNAFKLPWIKKSLAIDNDTKIISWNKINPKLMNELFQKISTDTKFEHYLTPFQFPDFLDKNCSFWAVKNNTIIGWSVIHRISKTIAQCTSLFVFPEHRNLETTKRLLAHNQACLNNKYQKTIFQVLYSNDSVRRLLKILYNDKNSIIRTYQTIASSKKLD